MVVGPLAGGQLVDTASLALDLRDQRPVRARHARARRRARSPARATGASRPARRLVGARARARSAWPGPTFALIRQPDGSAGAPRSCSCRSLGGIALLVAFVPVYERRAPRPDAAARPVPRAQLRGRQRRDVLRCTRGLGVLFFLLVIFLQQVAGYTALEAGLAHAAHDDRHVPAVQALRRARRPPRPAAVHGLRPARRRRRPAAASARRRRRRLRAPRCCRRCSCSRSACR